MSGENYSLLLLLLNSVRTTMNDLCENTCESPAIHTSIVLNGKPFLPFMYYLAILKLFQLNMCLAQTADS